MRSKFNIVDVLTKKEAGSFLIKEMETERIYHSVKQWAQSSKPQVRDGR